MLDEDVPEDIHHAAKNGNMSRLTSLISSTASLDLQDEGGFTPLHWAAYSGQSDAVQVLVDAKAGLPCIGLLTTVTVAPCRC